MSLIENDLDSPFQGVLNSKLFITFLEKVIDIFLLLDFIQKNSSC